MKKIVCISGILTAVFLILLLTGWADADNSANIALKRGNEQYAEADYENALASYEMGLGTNPENQTLNFNAAQAAYFIGDYEKAAGYYDNSADCVDKYLNAGNIFFRAGDALEDVNQKLQCYAEALQIYMEGIIKYPQNVPLKYNYESVKALVDELMEEMGQDGESGDNGESGEQSESDTGEQSESDNGTQNENEAEESESTSEGEEGEGQNSYSEDETEYDSDQEAIARILEMLESQEEESLKNNQEVASGKDDANGW